MASRLPLISLFVSPSRGRSHTSSFLCAHAPVRPLPLRTSFGPSILAHLLFGAIEARLLVHVQEHVGKEEEVRDGEEQLHACSVPGSATSRQRVQLRAASLVAERLVLTNDGHEHTISYHPRSLHRRDLHQERARRVLEPHPRPRLGARRCAPNSRAPRRSSACCCRQLRRASSAGKWERDRSTAETTGFDDLGAQLRCRQCARGSWRKRTGRPLWR